MKFPIRSANIPASGGITIATRGVMELIIAVSSTFIPNSLMCIVKYGYNTEIAKSSRIRYYAKTIFKSAIIYLYLILLNYFIVYISNNKNKIRNMHVIKCNKLFTKLLTGCLHKKY